MHLVSCFLVRIRYGFLYYKLAAVSFPKLLALVALIIKSFATDMMSMASVRSL